MNQESLQKLFNEIKNSPSETTINEVSGWLDTVSITTTQSGSTSFSLTTKIISMVAILAIAIAGSMYFMTDEDISVVTKTTAPSIENNSTSRVYLKLDTVDALKKDNVIKAITIQAMGKDSVPINTIIPTQQFSVDPETTEQIENRTQNEQQAVTILTDTSINEATSGSWNSIKDTLHIDTVFNGVKALVFKGHVNNKIAVHGSNRSNVSMNFNYRYKVKGIYTRKNRECEVSYEKKDSVLTIEIERKNPVNIGVSYSKENSDLSFEVPENIAVQIKTSFGDIAAYGLKNNEYDLQTTYGDIKATLISGDINLYSGYGDIDLNDLNGKADIKTNYGDIKGNKITVSEKINLKSGYGKIDCEIMNPVADCELDLKTGYGKVKINRADLKLAGGTKLIFGVGKIKLTAKSGYGDVIIR